MIELQQEDKSKVLDIINEKVMQFLQEFIKAPHKDPILISKDSLLGMLHKVSPQLHLFTNYSAQILNSNSYIFYS